MDKTELVILLKQLKHIFHTLKSDLKCTVINKAE